MDKAKKKNLYIKIAAVACAVAVLIFGGWGAVRIVEEIRRPNEITAGIYEPYLGIKGGEAEISELITLTDPTDSTDKYNSVKLTEFDERLGFMSVISFINNDKMLLKNNLSKNEREYIIYSFSKNELTKIELGCSNDDADWTCYRNGLRIQIIDENEFYFSYCLENLSAHSTSGEANKHHWYIMHFVNDKAIETVRLNDITDDPDGTKYGVYLANPSAKKLIAFNPGKRDFSLFDYDGNCKFVKLDTKIYNSISNLSTFWADDENIELVCYDNDKYRHGSLTMTGKRFLLRYNIKSGKMYKTKYAVSLDKETIDDFFPSFQAVCDIGAYVPIDMLELSAYSYDNAVAIRDYYNNKIHRIYFDKSISCYANGEFAYSIYAEGSIQSITDDLVDKLQKAIDLSKPKSVTRYNIYTKKYETLAKFNSDCNNVPIISSFDGEKIIYELDYGANFASPNYYLITKK